MAPDGTICSSLPVPMPTLKAAMHHFMDRYWKARLRTMGSSDSYETGSDLPRPPPRRLKTTCDSLNASRYQRPGSAWPTADSRRDPTNRGQREGASDRRERADGSGCRRYNCPSCLMQLSSCIWDTRDSADTYGDYEGHASRHPRIYTLLEGTAASAALHSAAVPSRAHD